VSNSRPLGSPRDPEGEDARQLIDELVAEATERVDAGRGIDRRWPPPPEKHGTATSVRELIKSAYGYRYTSNVHIDEVHWANLARKLIDLATIRRTGSIDSSDDADIQRVANLVRAQLSCEKAPLHKLEKEKRLIHQWPELSQAIMDVVAELDATDPMHGRRSAPESLELQAVACFRMLLATLVRKRIEREPAWLDAVEPQPPSPPRRQPVPEPRSRDLVYAIDEADHVLFAPRAVALEIIETREKLAACQTWGDARASLPGERLDELVDELVAPNDQPPDDDAVIDAEDLDNLKREHDWPRLPYDASVECLPEDIVEEFGTDYSGAFDSGVHLDVDRVDELVESLEAAGYRCEQDPRVEALFGFDVY
jgi:hypothetical protein